ncbi:MAG: hypothetical protein IPP85_07420 [Propionivibrio sp.]|nr:hypothetical protein [Propionivibrio sp.]
MNLESSQVETAAGLTKLACLAIQAAVLTMQLTLARDGHSAVQAADVFNADGSKSCSAYDRPLKEKRKSRKTLTVQAPLPKPMGSLRVWAGGRAMLLKPSPALSPCFMDCSASRRSAKAGNWLQKMCA